MPTDANRPPARSRRLLVAWVAYLLLLGASHLAEQARAPVEHADTPSVEIPLTDDHGPIAGTSHRNTYRRWRPDAPDSERVTVILLHGSPGEGANFAKLGPILADRGYDAIAPDLPGFGGSAGALPSYSILAHAYALRIFMDELGIDRAHLVGWSQGGGVALHLADLAPDRVATLTLMASIGEQRAEGSGSYWFEHAKYAVGYAGLVVGGELVPHFGLLGSHAERRAFMRNFSDSDQRPLRGIMQSLDTPTLILHGDDDFLTPEWGSRLHHQLIGPSKLVILDASHFLPFRQADEVAARMDHFYQHNTPPPGVERPAFFRELIDLSPPATTLGARMREAVDWAMPFLPWWVVAAALGVLAFRRAELSAAVGGFLVSMVWTDAGVAIAALFAGVALRALAAARGPGSAEPASPDDPWRIELSCGRFGLLLRTRLQPWRRDAAMRAARATGQLDTWALLGALTGCALWTALAFLTALITSTFIRVRLGDSLPGFALALLAAIFGVRAVVLASTWTGRQRLKATLRRGQKHEFWPPWAYYSPLVPWLLWHGLRHGGLMACTRVNPVIGAGGGVVGESKHAILEGLRPVGDAVLRAVYLDTGDPDRRFATLQAAMESGGLPRGYPLVLKPDAGMRGYAVRIARSDDDAREYLARMARPVVAQAFHPGPVELGVMWVRDPDAPPGRVGRVFSLTIKRFPDLVGDGRHTVEQLVYRDRRFRCQADMLLERFAPRRFEVLGEGEHLRLTTIGNHSKGAIFCEAAEHITPELDAWIDRAAAAFRAPVPEGVTLPEGDNGLDFGRFDIRARSIEDVRAATGLAIIELNGTAAESTNIYDPDRPLWWSWRMLLRHWAILYQLGGRRRRMGVPAMSPLGLLRAWREFNADRPDIGAGESGRNPSA